MEPTGYFGRSRFIGIEPFTGDPPESDAVSPVALKQCRDNCIKFLEQYWSQFSHAKSASSPSGSTGTISTKNAALTAEDFAVMALIRSRASGDPRAYLNDERLSGKSTYTPWRHFLFEDTNQQSARTGGGIDPPTILGATDERILAGFHVSMQHALFGEMKEWQLNLKMLLHDNQHLWLLRSLKSYFQRPRPFQSMVDFKTPFFVYPSESAHHPAFPAGHTLQSAHSAATLLITPPATSEKNPIDWKRHQTELAGWAAAVSDRRIDCGLHFPSDAFGGWAVAVMLSRVTWPNDAKTWAPFFNAVIEQSEVTSIVRTDSGKISFPQLNAFLDALQTFLDLPKLRADGKPNER